MFGSTTTVGTHHAEAVGIVDEDTEAVFLLQGHYAGKVAQSARHAIHALGDDKDAATRFGYHLGSDLQLLLKVFHVVMAVFILVADMQTNTVKQAGMGLVVVDDDIMRASQSVDG